MGHEGKQCWKLWEASVSPGGTATQAEVSNRSALVLEMPLSSKWV
jgi:hypothetical protein